MNNPYHYRWSHLKEGQSFGDYGLNKHCDRCLCYVCNIKFGQNGCKIEGHRFASPSIVDGRNLWPVLRDDVANQSLNIPSAEWDLWWTREVIFSDIRYLNLSCLEVPDCMLLTYLASGCDASVCHHFRDFPNFGSSSGCKQSKGLIKFIKLLSPEGRVTKPMIGNNHKPFLPLNNKIYVTLQYEQEIKKLTARAFVHKTENFCAKLSVGATTGFVEHGLVSSSSSTAVLAASPCSPPQTFDGSRLVPHQLQLLQSMWYNETFGISPLLWFEKDECSMQIAKVAEYVVRLEGSHHILDGGLSGGVVSMPVCSGKSRVVLALLAFRPLERTIIVIKNEHDAWHWVNDSKVYGIDCQHITSIDTICTSNTCVVAWNILQACPGLWQADRVVYDDLLRYMTRHSPITASCNWALTTPDQLSDGKRKFSSIIRFLFYSTIYNTPSYHCNNIPLSGGIVARICNGGGDADAVADNLAKEIQPLITLTRNVVQTIRREQEKVVINFSPSPAWAAEYRACQELIERNNCADVTEKLLGAIAGNNKLTFDHIFPATQPALPHDFNCCCVCHSAPSEMRKPTLLPCNHYTCYTCIMGWIAECATNNQTSTCPMCRQAFTPEKLVDCGPARPDEGQVVILTKNTEKLDFIVKTCIQRLRYPNTRILLLSRFLFVRKSLSSMLQNEESGQATADLNKFFSSSAGSQMILIASPADLLQLRIMGMANVVIFAEPCVDKAMAETICKRLTTLDSQHDVSILTIATAGTHEINLCVSSD